MTSGARDVRSCAIRVNGPCEPIDNSQAMDESFDARMTTPAPRVSRKSLRTANGRRSHAVTARVVREIDTLRRDCGVSSSALARAASVDQGYLSQVIAGHREPSIAVLTAIAIGAWRRPVASRSIPTPGRRRAIASRARIVEELLRIAAPHVAVVRSRWRSRIRHAGRRCRVRRPGRQIYGHHRGAVADRSCRTADPLGETTRPRRCHPPTCGGWEGPRIDQRPARRAFHGRDAGARPTISRRPSRRPTRLACRRVRGADDIDGVPWPGTGVLWADVSGDTVCILARPPRGVLRRSLRDEGWTRSRRPGASSVFTPSGNTSLAKAGVAGFALGASTRFDRCWRTIRAAWRGHSDGSSGRGLRATLGAKTIAPSDMAGDGPGSQARAGARWPPR